MIMTNAELSFVLFADFDVWGQFPSQVDLFSLNAILVENLRRRWHKTGQLVKEESLPILEMILRDDSSTSS